MSLRTRLLIAALVSGLLGLVWVGVRGHYIDAGVRQERAVWVAAETKRERQQAETAAETYRLGQRAAAAMIERERAERSFADRLTQERRHAVLVATPLACGPGPAVAGAEHLAADPSHPTDQGSAPSPSPGPSDGLAPVRLSLDAFRLWNSALAGVDVPAGACGTDGGTAGACAADAGVSLTDAWDNQAANALSCRVDRDRYRRLINFLTAREQRAGTSTTSKD